MRAAETRGASGRECLFALALGAVLFWSSGVAAVDQHPVSDIYRPKVIFFDVVDTLLDPGDLEESVGEALQGRSDLVPLWHARTLNYVMAASLTGTNSAFSDIAAAALVMVASEQGMELTLEAARRALEGPSLRLASYPDVKPGLQILKEMGFSLVTLSNASEAEVSAQMERAGLDGFFERHLSAESLETYKPDLDVYLWALSELKVAPDEAMLLSSHHWDLMGAAGAGMQTVFLSRPGRVLSPLGVKPDTTVSGVKALADKLVAITD